MSGLGVALGGALIVGVAAAVVVITDTSEVGAYLADAGTVSAAGNRCDDDADNVCILSADAVSLTADRTSTLHASTFGIAIAGIAAVGAAVAVAEVKGSTTAYIGKGAQLGRSGIGQSIGSVGATATTIASVGPFGDSKTMSVGISAAILGSAAAGVAVGTVWPDTAAAIRDDVLIYASGLVSVHADSTLSADVQADGGAIGFVAVGAMVAVATVGKDDGTGTAEHGITRASLGARAVIRAGAASLSARSGAAATGADGLGLGRDLRRRRR